MLVDHALQYAMRGWRVFPLHSVTNQICSCPKGADCGRNAGKHPRVRGGFKAATTDSRKIEAWWRKWSDANVGIATGRGLTVLDVDGPAGLAELQELVRQYGVLPTTLAARTGNGLHLYFGTVPDALRSHARGALHVRSEGGFVVAPPSLHRSGRQYQWINRAVLAVMPDWLIGWAAHGSAPARSEGLGALGTRPSYLTRPVDETVSRQALRGLSTPWTAHEEARLRSALAVLPADAYDTWLRVGMALHGLGWDRSDGSSIGFDLWDDWSATCDAKYSQTACEEKWTSFGRSSGSQLTIATVYALARDAGWSEVQTVKPEIQNQINGNHALPEALTQASAENPLIELNKRYAVIGDIGGKCLVLSFVPSKVDETIRVPSFQTFRSFGERYANQYITVRKADRDGNTIEEAKQLGAYWLKWTHRRNYEGIDLDPAGGPELPGGILNLWTGFAVGPNGVDHSWQRLRWHIAHILAAGDAECATYIFKHAAWCVQHPAERAEVALVFRGGKGSGKGTYANAMKQLFGQHGLQIFNSKHLVGSFNGHLRNCLLLFADEAFWAGDKQGESVLKGLITEPTLMIEQKGVDATPWKNRLHVIMSANAEWVVPASHDERRYAMFDVSEDRIGDRRYFAELHREIVNGGLAAMLRDLLKVDLGDWHPRQIIETPALATQKALSLGPLREWWESLLQEGRLPLARESMPDTAPASALLNIAKDAAPKLRNLSATAMGRFLRDQGCVGVHTALGNVWRFPALTTLRTKWRARYRGWEWRNSLEKWNS